MVQILGSIIIFGCLQVIMFVAEQKHPQCPQCDKQAYKKHNAWNAVYERRSLGYIIKQIWHDCGYAQIYCAVSYAKWCYCSHPGWARKRDYEKASDEKDYADRYPAEWFKIKIKLPLHHEKRDCQRKAKRHCYHAPGSVRVAFMESKPW